MAHARAPARREREGCDCAHGAFSAPPAAIAGKLGGARCCANTADLWQTVVSVCLYTQNDASGPELLR